MSQHLRRLLSYLPSFSGGKSELYVRSSWHKPTPFDQWRSQPPFRPMVQPLRGEYFGSGLRRQRLVRRALWIAAAVCALWLIVESVRGLAQL